PSSRQKGTPVASTRLSPLGSPRSSHSPIRSNGRTPSSSEPCRRGGRWSYRISSRCLKRGMLLLSIIAGAKINHGKGGEQKTKPDGAAHRATCVTSAAKLESLLQVAGWLSSFLL